MKTKEINLKVRYRLSMNHNESALTVRKRSIKFNHNETTLIVRKRLSLNHNETALRIK